MKAGWCGKAKRTLRRWMRCCRLSKHFSHRGYRNTTRDAVRRDTLMDTPRDWTQHAKRLFQMPKPAHFTNDRHCCECAEHDATLLAYDVDSIGVQQLGN